MSQLHLHLPSFNAGELSPLLAARFAVEKVEAGCRRLRNFLIHPHGPAFRRPGMEYMGPSMGSAQKSSLRPFTFSTATGAILEFHPEGLNVWSNGQHVALKRPVVLPYTEQECAELQLAQVNDVVYVVHPKHEPVRLVRKADDDWVLEPIAWKWPPLGDENVRDAEAAVAANTRLLRVPLFELNPEFLTPGGPYTLSVVNPLLTGTRKKHVYLDDVEHAPVKKKDLNWVGAPPTNITDDDGPTRIRLRYVGDPGPEGSQARVDWDNDPAHPSIMDLHDLTPNLQPAEVRVGAREKTYLVPPSGLSVHVVYDKTLLDKTPSATKKLRLMKWNGSVLVDLITPITWTDTPPNPPGDAIALTGDDFITLSYSGPPSQEGARLALNDGTAESDGVDPHPPEHHWMDVMLDKTQAGSTGDYQVTVDLTQTDRLAADCELRIQSVDAHGNRTNIKRIFTNQGQPRLKAGTMFIWRGTKLEKDTTILLNWFGRAAIKGFASLELLDFPKVDELKIAVDGISGSPREMTSTKPLFKPGHVGSYWQISHRRDKAWVDITAHTPSPAPDPEDTWNFGTVASQTLRVQGTWEVFSYGAWKGTVTLKKLIGQTFEVVRSWSGNFDRNIAASGEEEEDVVMQLTVTGGVAKAADTVGEPRFVLEATDAISSGIVQILDLPDLDLEDEHLDPETKTDRATVKIIRTLDSTAPTTLWTEGAWSKERGFPRTVTLHGQRLWFGGTETEPQRVWGSVVNDYQNFHRSSLDDASVSFTPAAQTANPIQWMSSSGTLCLGTTGDEWTIGADNDGIVTPTNVNIRRRSGYGSQFQNALIMGDVLVFVQRNGLKLRQVAPRTENVVWSASDMTVLAEHVTRAGVIQIAAMNAPMSILWAVTGDGKLLGMTFEQEQNVFGWHVHETDGLVESVAVIYGPVSDEVWVAVKRGGRRNIERLDPAVLARQFNAPARMIYVDAAVRREADTPMTIVDGLEHLDEQVVSIVGDGAEQRPARVVDGQVELEFPAKTVVLGLPFTSELQPMRKELQLANGTAQHRNWRVSRVGLYILDSIGGEIADGPEARFEKLNFRRAGTPMDSPIPLFTGDVETPIESHARGGADVVVRQTAPFPLNIGSLTIKGDVYGE